MKCPDWLRSEIIDGLQKLFVLRLEGTPAHDTAKAVANVWIDVISTQHIEWDEHRDLFSHG